MAPVTLVTGASGFAGGHLVEQLAGSTEVVAWARSAPAPAVAGAARWQHVDLLDRERVRSAISETRPTAVYHCAGLTHVGDSWSNTAAPLRANVIGTHHLLDALRRAGVAARVLIPGSGAIYAPSQTPLAEDDPIAPGSPYALSKLAQEQLGLRVGNDDGIAVVVTRSFNHTGPRQTPAFVTPSIARQIALIERGALAPVIRVGNIDVVRDLSDVRDVARAYIALMEAGTPGEVYNVASGVARSIRSILDALVARATVPVRIETDPARVRPNDTSALVGNPERLHRATGWAPRISFDQLLDDLLGYWRKTVEDQRDTL